MVIPYTPIFEFDTLPVNGGLYAFDAFSFGENEFTIASNTISGQDFSNPSNDRGQAAGQFFFRPNDPHYFGVDSFTWTAIDNKGKRWPFPQTVTLNVLPVNDPPVISRAGGTVIPFTSGSSLVTITDIVITDDLPTSHNGNMTLKITSALGGAINVTALNLFGTVINFSTNLGNLPAILSAGIRYSSPNFASDQLIISVNDNGNIGIGGPKTTTQAFTFTLGQALNALTGPVTGAMVGATSLIGILGGAIYAWMRKKKLILAEESDPWANDQMFENQLDNPVYSSNPNSIQVPPE